MKTHYLLAAVVAAACALAAQAPSRAQPAMDHSANAGTVMVMDPWARATPGRAANGAAYFTVVNRGAAPDRLVGADSPAADRVELHTHIHDGGVMRMRKVEAVDLGPGGSVTFRPGGYHVMLMGLKRSLRQGETFPLNLRLEKSAAVTVTVKVMGIGAMGPEGGAHGPHGGSHK